MTNISGDDVRHLARLSSLQLSDDEVTDLQQDLARILAYVEQLNELDTDGVEPTYQTTGLTNVCREDEVEAEPVTREQLLALSPESKDTSVSVPQVL